MAVAGAGYVLLASSCMPSQDPVDLGPDPRTLTSCETNIDAAAPAFFKTYFRCVAITMNGSDIVIASDNLPPHPSYYYGKGSPNFAEFERYGSDQYGPNPNLIGKRSFKVTLPNVPVGRGLTITAAMVDGVVGSSPDEFALGPVGVALDSVALFNPLARPGDDIENEKYTFDSYNAHPAPEGSYHYHTATAGPLEVVKAAGFTSITAPGMASVELFGIMCDGTVVLGCTEINGDPVPATTLLDGQGGHVGDIRDAAGVVHFAARYHTHICPSTPGARRFTPEIQYYDRCGR
jgi:hypothetical protein